jgi:hypothetical protein
MAQPDLSQAELDWFWGLVRHSVRILGGKDEATDRLLQVVSTMGDRQRLLFFHSEPFDVARDLLRIEHSTAKQLEAYMEHGRKADDRLRQADGTPHPSR